MHANRLIMIAAAVTLAACTEHTPSPADRAEKAVKNAAERAEKAAEVAKDYTVAKKEEYGRKVEKEFAEQSDKIDALKKKAESLAGEAKAKMQEQFADVEKKREVVKKKMGDLKTSTSQAWDDIKVGIDRAMADMKEAYEKARNRF